MGQKVNPNGMRVGIYRNWNSRWYADDHEYHVFLNEDIRIRKYLTKELKKAMLSRVEIERQKTDKGNKVVILAFVALPGQILGQDGAKLKEIKAGLRKIVASENMRINIVEVKQPDLDANIVAQSIAKELEERASFRVAQKKAIQRVRRAGAEGCRTLLSGRLGGAEIARHEGYKEGSIPLHTLRNDIDFAIAEAATTYGLIGVKVWICRGVSRDRLGVKKVEREGE